MTWLRLLRARLWASGLTHEFVQLQEQRAGIDAALAQNERDCERCARELEAAEAAHKRARLDRRFRVRASRA